jgi:GAF domain-containing protein/HAMP domain-containing protein
VLSEGFVSRCSGEELCLWFSDGVQSDPETFLIAAIPVVDEVDKQVLGFLVGKVQTSALVEMLDSQKVGGSGSEVYLVGEDYVPYSALRYAGPDTSVHTEGIRRVLDSRDEASGLYANYAGMRVVGIYRWLPSIDSVLVVEQRQVSAFAATYAVLAANGGVAVIVALVATFIALSITRTISEPLVELADTAAQVARGNLDLQIASTREDEVGSLARAFDAMTAQLRDLVRGLERTVTERTVDLELRSSYLESAAEVGRVTATILDPERLMEVAVGLIRDRFDLDYVGLFQIKEGSQYAVIHAETAKMKHGTAERRRRILLSESALDRQVHHGAIGSDNEDEGSLTVTSSEMTLLMRSRGRVLGAILVEGDGSEVFDRDMIVALDMVTDQIAVALDNALLFQESEAALESARRISGELSREAWAATLRSRASFAFRSNDGGTARLDQTWLPELDEALSEGESVVFARQGEIGGGEGLAVPVRVQGEVIGILDMYKPAEAGSWTSEQISLVEQISGQLSDALENARLYEETQRRATREQQLREIGTRMQSTANLDAIMQMAIEDLARALDVPSAFVQLHEARLIHEE